MPWTCPSCHLPIQHDSTEQRPRPHVVYRCHICRLDLVVDAARGKLITVLLNEDAS